MTVSKTIVITEDELRLEREQAQLEVVQNLSKHGFEPDTISTFTGINLTLIRKVILRSNLTPAEQEIASQTRLLMTKCLTLALEIMDSGPPEWQHQIMLPMVRSAVKLIGGTDDTTSEDIQAALDQILADQRALPQ